MDIEKAKQQFLSKDFIEPLLADLELVCVAISDFEGKVEWVSESCISMSKSKEKNTIIGTYMRDWLEPDSRIVLEDMFRTTIEQGRCRGEILSVIGADGKTMHNWHRLHLIRDDDGSPLAILCAVIELTQLKKTIDLLDNTKTALKVLADIQKEQIEEKQLNVIGMIKMQGDALCPGKHLRGEHCPAILEVEKMILKDRPGLKMILTNTELEVAGHTKQGLAIKKIANIMGISERTVKNHRHSIRKKLNISLTSINLTKYLQNFPS